MEGIRNGVRRAVGERARSLADALSFLAQWVLYRAVKALSFCWTRDDSLWAFGARAGGAFADNAKYLYLHVATERPDVRPVWLSKDREVVAELQSAGYEAYHCYSLRGLALNLRAGVVFLTHGHRDLAMPCCAGALNVMLWHGLPLKRVSWDAGFADEPAAVRAAHAHMAGEFDLLTVPGPQTGPFESGLRIDRDRMVETGYPRNDALFDAVPGEQLGTDADALARVRDLAGDRPVVCYLPTFREWDPGVVAENVDFAALEDFLADRDAYLAVKTHPNERLDLSALDLDRVVELPEATDAYPLLRRADALVTDYSSVYFDYLLLDRPVAFYAFDLDRYRAERGFYFEYDDVTPGPVARDFEGLLDALDRTLDAVVSDEDPDADRRRAVRESMLGESTANAVDSSARVYEAVRRRLGEGAVPDRESSARGSAE
ncbi:CDP-glycerol glycerophosphotransferase family protein [Halorussus salilacus]|uniref:CDP-glycerol glycerophosphotransferase family protein n=1 Tax=Halorussus salilacus TaxID=2953750 RepID=UPI00209FB2C5|nr:CDP-glycerol glycerophosphotransferase family protein [Halorussus salilacus]USZ67816.1 CDP-glycerol glycerophosphotransferase family protein [Halorussus salilacus]